MASRDIHHKMAALRSISPVAVGTTGTGQTGKIIDTAGYQGVEILLDFGTITATNAAFTVTIKEGAVTGTMTSVADADLLGLESLGTVGQAATRTSGVSKNVTKRIGYIGSKRYIQANIKSTVTAGTPVAATVLLMHPTNAPVAT